MKILLPILMLVVVVGCTYTYTTKPTYDTTYDFLNCDLDIPIVDLDYTKDDAALRKAIEDAFGEDLCNRCGEVAFKIPATFNDKQGYQKVWVNYENPYCGKCPVYIRLKQYYRILVGESDHILVNNDLLPLDSLRHDVVAYYRNVGIDEDLPKDLDRVKFKISWNKEASKVTIERVLNELNEAQITFVAEQLALEGLAFDKLTKEQVQELKQKYKLHIAFDLGSSVLSNAPLPNNIITETAPEPELAPYKP